MPDKEVGATPNLTPTEIAQFLAALGALSDGPPFTDGLTNVTGTITLNRDNGLYQRVTLTGNAELVAPTGGTSGKKLELDLFISGGDRTLTVNAAILTPYEWTSFFPMTLTSGKTYTLLLRFDGAQNKWKLLSLTGGY